MNDEFIKDVINLVNEIDDTIDYDNPFFSSIENAVNKVDKHLKKLT